MNNLKETRKSKYSKVVYVAGRFQNVQKNKDYIELCCRRFREDYPNYLFINGVSEFAHFYDCTSQEEGLSMCIELLLGMADELWVVGDYGDSVGTWVEIMVAKEYGIPVLFDKDTDFS